ncbi:MAG TPA: PLP-dependent aminotransferase family protein [Spirochaetes bacterium]|nr:PLP-dependent aminotransferase family protein [Spirochaetota bacterium]
MDFTSLYSETCLRLKSSKIRELFKMANVPGIISMAGGMPDSQNLPVDEVKDIINRWSSDKAKSALQYGTTKGFQPLLEGIKERMINEKMFTMDDQEIIITTGSQQALALLSKLFIDKDDAVIVEIPSFIGAIASFYSYMGQPVGVPIDENGIIIDELIKKIEDLGSENKKVKFIYTIPNFNNPSGITLSQERRKKVLEISYRYGVPIIEDDPYGDLYFDGEAGDYRPIKSIDKKNNVIYLGTFSKVLSPGIRVGWIVAQKELVAKIELQKQSFDACTPTLSQVIAYDYLTNGYIDLFTAKMRPIYKEKRDALLSALAAYMPEKIRWTDPKGGLFVWLTLPRHLDSETVFKTAVKRNVAFVTGDAFLPANYSNNYIRLTYGDLPVEKITSGVEILAGVISEML